MSWCPSHQLVVIHYCSDSEPADLEALITALGLTQGDNGQVTILSAPLQVTAAFMAPSQFLKELVL